MTPTPSPVVPLKQLKALARLIRYHILTMTTQAGSGHPTSSLSATELMTGLMFGGSFRFDKKHPELPNNDRLIFSKGHASPLFYGLWAAAGVLTEEELMTYRHFGSVLEGHPTTDFKYVEAATGSLGQGLAIGVGMALNAKYLDKLPYRTYVLLGDSEMAEGSQWESLAIAAHYHLDNLIGILDVNRLGQRGETMYGWKLGQYQRRIAAFGWDTIEIDGHSFSEVLAAFWRAAKPGGRPVMIIAKTVKGKGVSFLEDQEGWHGKALDRHQLEQALGELGSVDLAVRGKMAKPEKLTPVTPAPQPAAPTNYDPAKEVATRNAYGTALARLLPQFPGIVSLDGEVSNSTMAATFKEACPERFFEMYIAEQNMVGTALGLARRRKVPFASTFAAFLSRAYDQIRMSQYSNANLKLVGSHAGVSIGQDGPSQMALEDIAMMRAVHGSVVLYPSDAVSTEKLVERAAEHKGLVYLRTTRMATPILYENRDKFTIGGSKVLRRSESDVATVVAAGVTVFEALKAWEALGESGLNIRVIDLYSVKPLDEATLREAAQQTGAIITVEDHYPEGGLGEAVTSSLAAEGVPVHILAVRKKPKSGAPEELLAWEGISAEAIIAKVQEVHEAAGAAAGRAAALAAKANSHRRVR